MFDTVLIPCPKCGKNHNAQSKGGDCMMHVYDIDDAPADVMSDVNRHAPFTCENCGQHFTIRVKLTATYNIRKLQK